MSDLLKERYLAELLSYPPGSLILEIASITRNRLNAILGVASLLEDENEQLSIEESKDLLQLIQRSARDILNIMDAALAYDNLQRDDKR